MGPTWLTLMCVLLIALPLMTLTYLGGVARGQSRSLAVVGGLAFLVTWGVWYFRDEKPSSRWHRRSAPAGRRRARPSSTQR
jgi:hypothetical protein